MNIVGAGELAGYLGVSSQSIASFANDGKVVRISRGKYDLRASVQRYTAHLREVAAARGGEAQILDLNQERARLAREQADGQELKNRQARKELVPASDVEREWSDILRKVRAGILAVTIRSDFQTAYQPPGLSNSPVSRWWFVTAAANPYACSSGSKAGRPKRWTALSTRWRCVILCT